MLPAAFVFAGCHRNAPHLPLGAMLEMESQSLSSAKPKTNWTPCLMMMAVSFISYLDRNTLAVLAPTILQDLSLNAEQYGFAVSFFSVSYMIGNAVWGILLDRWGLRTTAPRAVSLWSVASALHGVV